jgi:predicted Zn-dependent protease
MVDRNGWSRRHLIGALAGAGAASMPGVARAQLLDRFLEDIGINKKLRKYGIDVDADKVVEGVKTAFQGFTLDESDEIRMGQELYPKLIQMSGGPYRNGRVQGAMQQIFQPLRTAARRKRFQWEITVVADDTVNAWALPGGKLAINRGLLRYIDSEDELAGVIAHEMGHVEFGHALAEMRNEKFMDGLGTVGREAISSQTRRLGKAGLYTEEALDRLSGPMHDLVTSGYSKSAESEADGNILAMFRATGGDPNLAVNFFRTLLQLIPENTKFTTSLFSSHPGTRKRIADILDAARGTSGFRPRRSGQAYAALKSSFPTRRHYKRRG